MASLRAAFAKAILAKNVQQATPGENFSKGLLPVQAGFKAPTPPSKDIFIGIVGAGAAGMAVAICLHIAGYKNVEILEADPNRIGGRCYTYEFKNGPTCPHNYYDVGAMRIPVIPTMQSTFTWIKYLNTLLPTLQKPLVTLADYVYNANCEPSMYFYSPTATGPDKFYQLMTNSTNGILTTNGFLDPKTLAPTGNFDEAFVNYINGPDTPDHYSTRGFLMNKTTPNWSYQDTEIAETFNTSTGLYDQAFMESICDFYDFQIANKAPWQRVEGGMSRLTDAMHAVAKHAGTEFTSSAVVDSMSTNDTTGPITVHYPGRKASYDAVFTTTTLGALQRMDLSGLNLQQEQLLAIRALSYDRATKVAIKFIKPWWLSVMPQPPAPNPPYKYGGVSGSDLTISNVVYPSWNDGSDQCHTIIVSYSWAQDATRMASLITSNNEESTNKEDPLIRMIFAQLQKLWSSVPAAAEVTSVESLSWMYFSHHAFSWAHDPHAGGGFALFGPGQFEYLYTQLTAPLLNNRFMVCGEAISAHHAWISGALDSAYNAVWAWLVGNGDTEGQALLKASPVGGGPGQHTAELDPFVMQWKVALTQQAERAASKS